MKKALALSAAAVGFALLVAGTALAVMEADRALTNRMADLKSRTMAELEAMAGRRITYGEISPSFFRSLEIRDLSILDSEPSRRPLITIRQIRVYYSLLRLLSSRDPVGAIREVQFLNTRVSVDLERDQDVKDLLMRLVESGGGPGQLHARISGANIGIEIVSGDTSLSLDNLFFTVQAQPATIAVDLRGSARGRLPSGFTFGTSLNVQGSLDRSLTASDMTVRLRSFQSSLFTTSEQTLQVVWKEDTLDVRKIQDRSPVSLDLQADLARKEFTLRFQSEGMRPDRLITLARRFDRYAGWMKTPVTASGHVTWRAAGRSLEYQVDASAFLADQLPFKEVSLAASLRGNEKEAFFSPLHLSSADGDVEFEGSLLFANFFPSGLLTLANIDSGTGERVSATLSIERAQGNLDVHSTSLSVGQVSFDELRLSLSPLPAGARFTLLASFAEAPPDDSLQAAGDVLFSASLGKAMTEGSMDSIPAPNLTVSATLSRVPPDSLYHLAMGAGALSREQADIAALLGTFSVSADVTLSTDFSTLSLQSSAVTVVQPSTPGTRFSFGLAASSSHVSLQDFTGTWKGFQVNGGFEGDIAADGQLGFSTRLSFKGTPYAFTGSYTPGVGLVAKGSYGTSLQVAALRNGARQVRLGAERLPLPLAGGPVLVSFDIGALVSSEGEWAVDIPALTVFDVSFLESKKNSVQVRGKLTPTRLSLGSVSFTDEFSTLSGNADAEIVLPGDLLSPDLLSLLQVKGGGSLVGPNGESYSLTGGMNGGVLSLDLLFAGLPLKRLGESAIAGSLSGSGTVAGPLAGPTADFAIVLKDGKLGTDPLNASGRVRYALGSVELQSLDVGYLSHRLTEGKGTLDVAKGTIAFSGRYQGDYFADQMRCAVAVDGHYRVTGPAPAWPSPFDDGLLGKVSMTGITVANTPFPAWTISVSSDAGKLSFDGGPGSSVHGWVDSDLGFLVSLADPLPLNGTAQGKVVGDQLDATADFETIDLRILNGVLKSSSVLTPVGTLPIYDITSGVATGLLAVKGPVNDPDFTGQLDVVGGGLKSAYSPDEAGPIRASLLFDGKTFHADKTVAAVGTARMSATASFTIDHWSPINYDITLATEGPTPTRVRGRFGRLIADGSASGQIRINGNDRSTSVTGGLVVTDCIIALGDTPPGQFTPEDPPTIVSLTAETGRRVEFYWPSTEIPVLRTTATPGGKVAVTYRGDTGAYSVKGSAGVQGGEIYYFDRSFILKKGTITFDEDQADFDPWITATAEVREWDPQTAEEVKISLDADSTLSKFSPRFSSDPPRSDTALLAMIGAPLLSRAETQGLGMAALVYSDILSQTWILRPFEQKVRQLLNLDMFSIRTQILQNLLAQRLFGSTSNPLDNTSVSLGKYLGNDLFLEMLVRLQQPQLPTGVSVPLVTGGAGLQPDLELTLEWTTPFFLLGWSFQPRHPESLFLSDNSLSFNWRFTY